jgi:hypothetical protein
MRMDRSYMKKLTRMGKVFLKNVGISMEMRLIVGSNLTVFELGVITRGV